MGVSAPTLTLPWWMPSPEAQAERERIFESQYFLVRTKGNGDVWKCRNCGAKHEFLTLRCVSQPFNGTSHGLFAWYRVTGIHGAEAYLSPAQRARYDRLAEMFGDQPPDLATSHPEMARKLATDERDMDRYTLSLGLLEPLTKQRAQQFANAINARGVRPRFTLPGLEV